MFQPLEEVAFTAFSRCGSGPVFAYAAACIAALVYVCAAVVVDALVFAYTAACVAALAYVRAAVCVVALVYVCGAACVAALMHVCAAVCSCPGACIYSEEDA